MRVGKYIVAAATLLAASAWLDMAQAGGPGPTVAPPTNSAVSAPLSAMPTDHSVQISQQPKLVPAPKPLPPRGVGPGGKPVGDDVLQKGPGGPGHIKPKASFGGIGSNGYIPPDPNIAVGKAVSGSGFIVQMVNAEIAVFDKTTHNVLQGPVSLSSFWTALGPPCSSSNSGDPVVQYDAAADRWVLTQLASLNQPYGECIAVSQTRDPTGAYYLSYFQIPNYSNDLNDYPKFGVWPTATNSAYLATYNLFSGNNFIGAELCAYDRNALLNNAQAAQICFLVNNDGNFLPVDLDGATPPSNGTPGYFLNFETTSSLRLYQLSPNFTNPGASTLTQVGPDLAVAAFNEACSGGVCIPQPGHQQLDSLGDRLMYRLAYRVFPDHAAMVVNHSVVAGSSVGVRWYELRQPLSNGAPTGPFALYQQGTYAPDPSYRWMGSAAMDGAGDIALGYSLSSGNLYPSIAFAGRLATDPLGTMGAETVLVQGNGAQTNYSRWGDYTSLRIDPDDDTTFWYTNEYYTNNSPRNYLWATAIGSFTLGGGGNPPPPPPPSVDFNLSLSNSSLTVPRGSSGSITVTITPLSGSPSVNLSASPASKGVNYGFSPNPTTATATMTVNANRKAALGTTTVTITGSDSTGTASAPLTLTIQ